MKYKNILSLLSFLTGLFAFIPASLLITNTIQDFSGIISEGLSPGIAISSLVAIFSGLLAGITLRKETNIDLSTKLLYKSGICFGVATLTMNFLINLINIGM